MLAYLLPNQISDYWPLMRDHINDSLPPTGDYGPYDMNNILFALLSGGMQLWAVTDKDAHMKGFVVTTVYQDVSGVRTLMIYNAVALEKGPLSDWTCGIETLKKFGRSRGCSKLGAFVANPKILEAIKEYDAELRFVFAHINL